MLPLALLIMFVVLVAITGGAVVWMVLVGMIAPEIAAGGSAIIMIGSFVALGVLFARMRARRTERDIHTIRRSQSVRERQPLRYALDEVLEREPYLVKPMPEARRTEPQPASPSPRPFDETALAAWLEPVVAMPLNETDAWHVLAGDGTSVLDLATLDPVDLVRAQLGTASAALRLAPKLDAPVMFGIGPDLLGDRDAALELRRLIETEPSNASHAMVACDLDALDVLAGGRLDDLVETGLGLALHIVDLKTIERIRAGEAAERGARFALIDAATLNDPMAARAVRLLREAGIETVGMGVADEDAMLRLADLGIMRFSGAAFGAPKRARATGEPRPDAPSLPPSDVNDAPATLPTALPDARD